MALSEEDKQRIRAEEEEREKAKKDIKEKESKKVGKGCAIILIIIFAIAVIIAVFTCSGSNDTPRDLNANVRFDGTQFHITNLDDYDWTDVRITLNGDYELRTGAMLAKTEYSVGAMQFAKKDGTKFNPFTTKAQRMFIWAYNGDNKRASWSGSWK